MLSLSTFQPTYMYVYFVLNMLIMISRLKDVIALQDIIGNFENHHSTHMRTVRKTLKMDYWFLWSVPLQNAESWKWMLFMHTMRKILEIQYGVLHKTESSKWYETRGVQNHWNGVLNVYKKVMFINLLK